MDALLRRLGNGFTYVFLCVLSLVSIFPFLWMAIGATNTSNEIVRGKVSLGTNLLVNVEKFFTQVNAPLIFWNSIKVALLSTFFTLFDLVDRGLRLRDVPFQGARMGCTRRSC